MSEATVTFAVSLPIWGDEWEIISAVGETLVSRTFEEHMSMLPPGGPCVQGLAQVMDYPGFGTEYFFPASALLERGFMQEKGLEELMTSHVKFRVEHEGTTILVTTSKPLGEVVRAVTFDLFQGYGRIMEEYYQRNTPASFSTVDDGPSKFPAACAGVKRYLRVPPWSRKGLQRELELATAFPEEEDGATQ